MSRFKKAIDAGNVALVRQLLDQDATLVSRPIRWGPIFGKCQTEPLHYLCDAPFNQLWQHDKQAELAAILVAAGAPVDGLPTAGETPLHGAASLGEPGVAEVLLDHAANIEAVARYPGIPTGTPLDFAVHFGMVDVVDLLVKRGAAVKTHRMAAGAGLHERIARDMATFKHNVAELMDVWRCASVCDRTNVVELLLADGVDVNADIDGATALHWAAWEAKPRMVQLLLDQGADSARLDQTHKLTPLGWARHRRKELGSRWGHDDVIRLLNDQA